jgi:hypothetical protein
MLVLMLLLTHSLKPPGFNPRAYEVTAWFQAFAFTCIHLCHYVAARGSSSVNWGKDVDRDFPFFNGVASIVLSWLFSPILSGAVAAFLFVVLRGAVLRTKESFRNSLIAFPIVVGCTITINMYFILVKAGLYKFNSVDDHELERAWLQPLNLKCELRKIQSSLQEHEKRVINVLSILLSILHRFQRLLSNSTCTALRHGQLRARAHGRVG